MYFIAVQSDQLYTWSDEYPETTRCRIAKTPQRAPAPMASTPSRPARFPHRALQTLQQTGMQMRRWSRPWPQVLSLSQLPGLAATNGLRAARVLRSDGRVLGQLPSGPRDLRGDLRDQPRTTTAPRGAIRGRPAPSAFCSRSTNRCRIGRRTPCPYAGSLARRLCPGFAHGGGP
jgi:hypothetical protein